jgi:DNA invertase Pin-like site-specific DNA recombinase
MRIAYVRVSTIEQNEARQIEGLAKYNIEKWFTEKKSGKDTNREKLQEMLDFVREGDTVYVHDFSRLARSTKDLLDLVELFHSKNVNLVSDKEKIDSSTPQGKLMITMIAAIYEFERTNTLERQREGIEIAKREGKYKGGQVKKIDQELFSKLYSKYSTRKLTKVQFAKKLGISRPTLDHILHECEKNQCEKK